jgi:hypothetical protein
MLAGKTLIIIPDASEGAWLVLCMVFFATVVVAVVLCMVFFAAVVVMPAYWTRCGTE